MILHADKGVGVEGQVCEGTQQQSPGCLVLQVNVGCAEYGICQEKS